jgi:glyoxylase-like metal-dependent hydrolase (beta-lactamase superfamily II)
VTIASSTSHRPVRRDHHDIADHGRVRRADLAGLRAGSAGLARPALNDRGYYVGRVERNLYWVTDGDYHSAFLATRDGVVLFDAPPSIGHNLQRAVDQVAAAEGVSSTVTHLVYPHHHSDHVGGSSLFGPNVVRIGHEETRRLLLRDNDPAKPAPEETFAGVLGAADVFTVPTAFSILESIRLDRGYRMDVHP